MTSSPVDEGVGTSGFATCPAVSKGGETAAAPLRAWAEKPKNMNRKTDKRNVGR
jgi:hypothetical protein